MSGERGDYASCPTCGGTDPYYVRIDPNTRNLCRDRWHESNRREGGS